MRVVQNIQMQIGEVDVSKVKFDLKSRNDIPKILRGLHICISSRHCAPSYLLCSKSTFHPRSIKTMAARA